LLELITRPNILNTTLDHLLLSIYQVLNNENFLRAIFLCIKKLIKMEEEGRRMVNEKEEIREKEDVKWIGKRWEDIIPPCLNFFHRLLIKVDSSRFSPSISDFVGTCLLKLPPLLKGNTRKKMEETSSYILQIQKKFGG